MKSQPGTRCTIRILFGSVHLDLIVMLKMTLRFAKNRVVSNNVYSIENEIPRISLFFG